LRIDWPLPRLGNRAADFGVDIGRHVDLISGAILSVRSYFNRLKLLYRPADKNRLAKVSKRPISFAVWTSCLVFSHVGSLIKVALCRYTWASLEADHCFASPSVISAYNPRQFATWIHFLQSSR
jgi:hypothetical protein